MDNGTFLCNCRFVGLAALYVVLVLFSFQVSARDAWADDPPPPAVKQLVEQYAAASSQEAREQVVAQLETLGDTEPEALNQLGILYLSRMPSEANLAEAMFNKAASAKSINGLMNLIGIRISNGRIAESCKAAEVAVSWPDGAGAPALGYLGECYRLGRNGPKSAAKAEPLHKEACRWSWLPSCNSAMTLLRSKTTPAGKKAYRDYLEKLSGADYEVAMYWLAMDLSNSDAESDQSRSVALLEKSSAAKYGPACTILAFVLWGNGDPSATSRVDDLINCGAADKTAPELAWAINGVISGLSGFDNAARASFERSYSMGFKQAGALAVAFDYPVPSGSDPAYCMHFCEWAKVIKEARRLRQLELDEQARQAEIDRIAQEMAAQEAAAQAAQQAEYEAEVAAQQAAYNARIAAQNAEARRERRRRFWGGVLTVALALATGYVQAQANAYATTPQSRPVYQPPAISAPYRPVYQPQQAARPAGSAPYRTIPQTQQTLHPTGQTQVCYVETSRGRQAITVNATQACPVSLQSVGQPLRYSGRGYLVSESVSGLTRICMYQGATGQSALNISASGVCPPSHEF